MFGKSFYSSFFFWFLSNFLIFNFTFAEMIIGNAAQQSFLQHYIFRSLFRTSDKLCELKVDKKIAICNAVMKDTNVFDTFEMHLNKNAFTINKNIHQCEKHSIRLNFVLEPEIPHEMFPCYGRHYPVRTSWYIDDYYYMIFLSEGPICDSLFIFTRELHPLSETYTIYGLMTNFSVKKVSEVSLIEEDLKYELDSLERVSYNNNKAEIELLFIRNVVLFSSHQLPTDVCNLKVEQKIQLCNLILSENIYRDLYWELNRLAFILFGSDCIEREVEFTYFTEFSSVSEPFYQKMFPCYGDVEKSPFSQNIMVTTFHLSAGFRKNSIIVHATYDDIAYCLLEFFENVNFDYIIRKK